jgi:hypothetical protein
MNTIMSDHKSRSRRLALSLLLASMTLFFHREAGAAFTLFDNFDTYVDGTTLVGQGPGGNLWTQTGATPGGNIVSSNFNSGLAAYIGPNQGSAAWRSLAPAGLTITTNNAASTVFYQFVLTDTSSVNSWNFIVTDRLPTDTGGSSQVQVNYDSTAANSGGGITTLRGRAGGSFKFLSTDGTKPGDVPLVINTTYSVWLLINKSNSNYKIFMQNDSIPALAASPKQLFADDGSGGVFGFRNGASANQMTNINIGAFGAPTQLAQSIIDNIYVDTANTNLAYPVPAPAVPTVSVPGITPALSQAYAGTALTLSVNALGSPVLKYRWQVDTGGGFTDVPASNTNSLVVNAATNFAPGTYTYQVIVTNGFGSVTSAPSSQITILAPSQPLIVTATTPSAATVYPGANVSFAAAFDGTLPIAVQWKKSNNQVVYTNLPGRTGNTLALTNVQLGDTGYYSLWGSNIVNAGYTVSSGDALLTVLANPPAPGSGYAQAIYTNNPLGYWRFNDPVGSSIYDYTGGHQAYNANITLGVVGLRSPSYPGFSSVNTAGSFNGSSSAATTGYSLLNGLTNFTITGWFSPAGANPAGSGATRPGLFGQNDVVEIGFDDDNGVNVGLKGSGSTVWRTVQSGAGGFISGNWYFVAVVADGTSLNLYVNGALRGQISNLGVPIGTSTDGFNMGGGGILDATGNYFNGSIEDVAVFAQPYSSTQVKNLYTTAAGLRAPVFAVTPTNQTIYASQTVKLVSLAEGADTIGYRWQGGPIGGPYTNLINGGLVSGVTASTLTISNITADYAMEYQVIATNGLGSATSAPPALLTVQPTSPAELITMNQQEANGQDWNNGIYWSDILPASLSAVMKPGSTYQILGGGRMRTPDSALEAVFPGDLLIVSGDGVWTNNPGPTVTTIGEIRFKQAPPSGTVTFKMLAMDGGQLDTGYDGVVELLGEMVVSNTGAIFYNDNTADRGYKVSSKLGGTGTIEFHGYSQPAYMPAYVYGLNIAGTNNTFSGQWNIVMGTLVASGNRSLGTNSITIGAQGAIEAGYGINNSNATLTLNGKFLLHENHAFKNVIVNGNSLANGHYTYAQLATSYPANFPATWTTQYGSTVNTASGSISVGVPPLLPPVSIQIQSVGNQVQLTWPNGTLLEATNLTGIWVTNNATSPYLVNPTGAQKFYKVLVQ